MGYADSSFQLDYEDSKSISGYVLIMNGGAIYWKSSNQHMVADSVCKVEYVVTFDAIKEAVWLKKFITKFGVVSSFDGLVLIFCDSTKAIA